MKSQNFFKKFEEEVKIIKENFQKEVVKIRTSRPSPALVEDILVEVYNSKMPIKHLASISIVPPNVIVLEVWDKSVIPAIKNAISRSQLGLTPVEDNNLLKLHLPSLNQPFLQIR